MVNQKAGVVSSERKAQEHETGKTEFTTPSAC